MNAIQKSELIAGAIVTFTEHLNEDNCSDDLSLPTIEQLAKVILPILAEDSELDVLKKKLQETRDVLREVVIAFNESGDMVSAICEAELILNPKIVNQIPE